MKYKVVYEWRPTGEIRTMYIEADTKSEAMKRYYIFEEHKRHLPKICSIEEYTK